MKTYLILSFVSVLLAGPLAAENLKAPSEIKITVPDYKLVTVDGGQCAEIPGGEVSYEHGKPMVPVYSVSAEYPKGVVVQDVTLVSRSKPEPVKGLKLAIFDPKEGQAGIAKALIPRKPARDWYPEKDFEWLLDEDPDGGSVLRIGVYPLRYREETGEGEFCRNYLFRVRTVKSPIEVTAVTVRDSAGGRQRMDLLLSNKGPSADLVVSSVIKLEGSPKSIIGLPLRLLKDLTPAASYTAEFDTGKLPPGTYRLETEIKDMNGTVLARRLKYFDVGRVDDATASQHK